MNIRNNRDLYKFDDFTLENYRKLLKMAKNNGFVFSKYTDEFDIGTKHMLWRHDVEFSPFVALEMARMEANEGLRSTFFFQLHSEFYNVLEKSVSNIVVEIRNLGHDIGLHFDSHYFNITNVEDLGRYLLLDKNYFENVFNMELNVFSFHNTNDFVLSCDAERYENLLNVYSNYFRENFSYCSDSTGFWRYERLQDVLNNETNVWLQVLTHDSMWSNEVQSPRQRVFQSIEANAKRIKEYYDNALIEFGAKNIDWNIND